MRKITFLFLAAALSWLIVYLLGCTPPKETFWHEEEKSVPMEMDVPQNPVPEVAHKEEIEMPIKALDEHDSLAKAEDTGHAPIEHAPSVAAPLPFPFPDPGTGGGSQGALKPVRHGHDDDDEIKPV